MHLWLEGGKIESARFCIPGVQGEFHLVVEHNRFKVSLKSTVGLQPTCLIGQGKARHTGLLNLVAYIFPGLGKTAAEEHMRRRRQLMDMDMHHPYLAGPKHSYIVLKCSDKRFLCHKDLVKGILAARFVRIS